MAAAGEKPISESPPPGEAEAPQPAETGAKPKLGPVGMARALAQAAEEAEKGIHYCIVLTACFRFEEDMLPERLWRADYLHSTLSPYYPGLVEALPTGKYTAVLFYGKRSALEGLPKDQANSCMANLPDKVLWQGKGPELLLFYARRSVREGRELLGQAMDDFRRGRGRPRSRTPTFGDHTLDSFGTVPEFVAPRAPVSPGRSPLPPRRGQGRGSSPPPLAPSGDELLADPMTNDVRENIVVARQLLDLGRQLLQGEAPRANVERPQEAPRPVPQAPVREPRVVRHSSDDASSGWDSTGTESARSDVSRRSRAAHRRRRRYRRDYHEREYVPKPKVLLPKYSGDGTRSSDGVSYFTWRHAVENLQRTYADDANSRIRLRQHVEQSLQGPAADLACSVGENATLDDLLAVFDGYYENAESLEQLQAQLHSLVQRDGENVTNFAVRICTLSNWVMSHKDNTMTPDQMMRVKRDRLHRGLRPLLRSSLNYMVDRRNPCTYEQLLIQAREIEKGMDVPTRADPVGDKPQPKPRAPSGGYAGGALFPNRRLKGHAVAARAQQLEVREEEDLVEEVDALEVGEATCDDSAEDETVELTVRTQGLNPRTNRPLLCLACGSPDHLVKECEYVAKAKQLKAQQLNRKEGPSRAARGSPKTEPPAKASDSHAGRNPQ